MPIDLTEVSAKLALADAVLEAVKASGLAKPRKRRKRRLADATTTVREPRRRKRQPKPGLARPVLTRKAEEDEEEDD